MAPSPSLSALAQALAADAAASRQRRALVLAGESEWSQTSADEVINALPGEWCWIGEGEGRVAPDKAPTLLGGEWHGLVYDARAGFDPDAFGAVAGTLRAGGLLLLLTPPLAEWHCFPDPQRRRIAVHPYGEEQVGGRFLERLARLLRDSPDCTLVGQGSVLPAIQPTHPAPQAQQQGLGECATADQRAAVEALCRVAQGHRRRPLVLVSDRGRGKSSALGLAAARLLKQGVKRIVVTAPRRAAVEQIFKHAGEMEGLRFEPPDRVAHQELPCDLLLVDEAAAIPAPLLERMLRRHARIAFATTVHGYEGTGRGFDLRFRKVLDEVTPQWRRLRLEQPIRWAEHDPVERLVFRALLLDAEPAADEVVAGLALEECRIERVGRDTLLQAEPLLSQLFGLLVLAHYRTTPADLRNLLDGPNIAIYLLRHGETLLAAALVAHEGGLEEALSQQVYEGRRRLHGNLLPQSLATHAGLADASRLRAARVMRIAVHPARQGEGLGRRLIEGIARQLDGVDYLGASFGGDARLLDFWRQCHCLPVRVGLKREASSGAHAVMVMRPLTPGGEVLFGEARRRLSMQLPTLLSEPLADLEAELVVRLLHGSGQPLPDEMAWADACAFAATSRDYGNCLYGLRQTLHYALSEMPLNLASTQLSLAIGKVLQGRGWPELVHEHALAGRKEAVRALRAIFRRLCEEMAPSDGE